MNFKLPQAVLFDLDGTLADNYDAITKGAGYALQKLGYAAPSREKIKSVVGGSILLTMERLIGKENALKAAEIYAQKAEEFADFGLKPMPYAREILETLRAKKIKTYCFTNKETLTALKVLKALSFDKLLDGVFGTSLQGFRKPMPEFTKAALKQFGQNPQTSLIIGDSQFDYLSAQNCSIASILTATGNNSVLELKSLCPQALAVCENLGEIKAQFFD